MTARFVAFEGGDASGKSTQAAQLAERRGAVFTREPGGTAIGEQLRSLLLDPANENLADRTEALLMAAQRAQHVAEVVRPNLEAGTDVVTDRYIASSLAYQGFGRGLPIDEVRRLSEFAVDGLWPDLIVLLVVDRSVAFERLGGDHDRLERAGGGFHERVDAGFAQLAEADPDGWVVVDGAGSVAEVAARIDAVVADRLGW